jgi:hypothetical protein
MLTILSLMSLSCFSQIGTSKDTTKVVIPQGIAKLVVKDLIRYDGCDEELKLTQTKLVLTEQREVIKDSTISLLTLKDSTNQTIIRKQQDQIIVLQEETKSLQKDIRRTKFQNVIYKVATIVSAFALTILIVTN